MDVVVVGGGSAGVAAAVSAARAGARTLLVEKSALLGGMPPLALVHTICGLYEIDAGERFVQAGFAAEFAKRLINRGDAGRPIKMGRVTVLPMDPSAFGKMAVEFAECEENLSVWTECELVAVRAAGGRVSSVEVCKDGLRQTLSAEAFVDCTGDAVMTRLGSLAANIVESARLQRPAVIFELSGVPAACLEPDARLRLAHGITSAVSKNELPAGAMGAAFRASIRAGSAFMTVDLSAGGDVWNPEDRALVAKVEAEGREIGRSLAAFLRDNVDGWLNVGIQREPVRAGIRESRRACGVSTLTGAQLLAAEAFEDAVALSAWPVELRETATGPKWRYPVAPAAIPLRALRHRDVENLWFGGRCISCDHEAQAAIRVIGTCLATGEAAGIAATLGAVSCWNDHARRIRAIRDEIARRC